MVVANSGFNVFFSHSVRPYYKERHPHGKGLLVEPSKYKFLFCTFFVASFNDLPSRVKMMMYAEMTHIFSSNALK